MQLPTRHRDYSNDVMDPSRWDGFELRDDDIVVCTAYKAGTTWTQTICALLIFDGPDFPAPLSTVSPWLELKTRSREEVFALYTGQTDRRIIKTHTPLDGIPYSERVTYLYCGRDPRDVFLSFRNHMRNMDFEKMAQRRKEMGEAPPPVAMPDEPLPPSELFKVWLSMGGFPWEQDGFPMFSYFNHAKSYWEYRHLPNLHFLHYADLQADLEGQMRRVAGILGIEVEEARWPALVEAARFDSVKAKPEQFAPEADLGLWKSTAGFFKTGKSGQWQGQLSEESLALYEQVKADRLPPELAAWIERGTLQSADPKA